VIRQFEQLYEQTLGSRIEVLEELEWQLKGILDNGECLEPDDSGIAENFESFRTKSDLLDDEEPKYATEQKSLKSLYREVAKAIHPDLASDDEQRMRRQELMAVANSAYETGDRSILEDIIREWEQRPDQISGNEIAVELVRVIRQIAKARQDIYSVLGKIDELKSTDIYRFKQQVEESASDGIDLMAEMAATIDLDIARISRRLAMLRGYDESFDEESLPPLETRPIRFPSDSSCGLLYERKRGSVDYREWRRSGNAKGVREVHVDNAVRLDIKGCAGKGLQFLDHLQGEDLQAIFMHEADDRALSHLAHLSGLEELCLSNSSVTDKGLKQLVKLHGLRRLYIYHTGIGDQGLMTLAGLKKLKWLTCSGTNISEEGLERFRKALPDCKAVNFIWRHGK